MIVEENGYNPFDTDTLLSFQTAGYLQTEFCDPSVMPEQVGYCNLKAPIFILPTEDIGVVAVCIKARSN